MADVRHEYLSKAKENLDLLSRRIVGLEAKANEKTGELHREFKAALSSICESKDQAERQLDELKLESRSAWVDVEHGVEAARNSLSDAIDNASERFQ